MNFKANQLEVSWSRSRAENSIGAEQTPGAPSHLQEHRVTNRVTGTMVLTAP